MAYPRKFAFLGLILLGAVTVVVHSLYVSLDERIQRAQLELSGLELIPPISRVTQLVQHHRGLSAGLLGGNAQMQVQAAAKAMEIEAAFKVLEGKLPAAMKVRDDWKRIRTSWENLKRNSSHLTLLDSFEVHTRLIGQLLLYETALADAYALTTDPDRGSYYLIDTTLDHLPAALEHLGQIRAYGIGVLASKQVTDAQKRKMYVLVGELEDVLKFFKINLDMTGRYNPQIQNLLTVAAGEIAKSTRQITDLVEADILTGHFATHPGEFFALTTGTIDDTYRQLYETLLPTAEGIVRERIDRTKNALYTTIGITFLLFLVVAYFSAAVYLAIAGNVRSLSQSARRFVAGNLDERIDLGTRDELKQVGDSFNEMAASFSAMTGNLIEARNALEQERQTLEKTVHERTAELQESNKVLYAEIVERKKVEAKLRLLAAVFERSGEAIMITDAGNNIVATNAAFQKLTGYTQDEVLGKSAGMLASDKTGEETIRKLRDTLNENSFWQGELWDRGKDGRIYPKWATVTAVRDEQGQVINYISSFSDITEHKAAQDKIRHLAHHDPLTNLPNRFTLIERLKQSIGSARRNSEKVAVMFIDLDRFKNINDTLGHDVGDKLLVQVAQRLQSCVRGSDIVARLGGDEFVVALAEIEEVDMVFHLADKIRQTLDSPYSIDRHELRSSPSIGIAFFPDDGENAEEVMKNADVAMYHAKSRGRNNYQFFEQAMNVASLERMELENDLRVALEREEFVLHYQPQINIATGRVIGVEALVRWQHPRKGLISPVRFIPIAEETGVILPLGEWVMRTACRQLRQWLEQGMADMQMCVNLSVRQFRQNYLPRMVASLVVKEDIDPSLLELEITESVAMGHPQETVDTMQMLRGIGVKLAIDDFGTGYSSLSYLKEFPINRLKLDRSFVKDIETDPNDAAICAATIALAHNLGLDVVAEGVETAKQHDYLRLLSCDKVQGYYFCKPMPAGEAQAYVEERNAAANVAWTSAAAPARVLVIDDDDWVCDFLKRTLEYVGHKPTTVTVASEGLARVRDDPERFGLIMLDAEMAAMPVADMVKAIRDAARQVPLVLLISLKPDAVRQALRPLERECNLLYGINCFILEKPLAVKDVRELARKILG